MTHRACFFVLSFALAGASLWPGTITSGAAEQKLRIFQGRGTVREIKPDGMSVVIAHEAISNYMAAMTMPFRVRTAEALAGLREGDEISFRLSVSDQESWIDRIIKSGKVSPEENKLTHRPPNPGPQAVAEKHPLLSYKFTNELGQAVSLSDLRGQALAITFFFTRCPIPDYCPRLSKNFQEASRKLSSMANAPTNWHLLSISFDPQFDSPRVLKPYGESYQYDPSHWSFWTGPSNKISELARLSDVTFDRAQGFFNHNFRTLIIDAAGDLQMAFPIGGNLSEAIVQEILKAAAATNRPAIRDSSVARSQVTAGAAAGVSTHPIAR